MWWVKTDSSGEDQNGFQNRDIGKRSHDLDFGPDFGVDYARFSDPPDIRRDSLLRDRLEIKIAQAFEKNIRINLRVRNGFVIVKGEVKNLKEKEELMDIILTTDGVVDTILDLTFTHEEDDGRKHA